MAFSPINRIARNMQQISLFGSPPRWMQYLRNQVSGTAVSVSKRYLCRCLTHYLEFTTDDVKLPSMVRSLFFICADYCLLEVQIASVTKTILDTCEKAAVDMTEPNAPITQPDEIARRRGFGLLALTENGCDPTWDGIQKRVADRLKDHSFCHSSPESKVHNVPSGCH